MKLDLTASTEDFRQKLSELLAGDSDIADQELDDLLKCARHGWKLKNSRSQPRQSLFNRLIKKSANRLRRYSWPITIERVAYGILEFQYDKDCYLIIDKVCFDEEKEELCVIWHEPKSGKRKATSYSDIAKVLKRGGIKYESYLNKCSDASGYRLPDELNKIFNFRCR